MNPKQNPAKRRFCYRPVGNSILCYRKTGTIPAVTSPVRTPDKTKRDLMQKIVDPAVRPFGKDPIQALLQKSKIVHSVRWVQMELFANVLSLVLLEVTTVWSVVTSSKTKGKVSFIQIFLIRSDKRLLEQSHPIHSRLSLPATKN